MSYSLMLYHPSYSPLLLVNSLTFCQANVNSKKLNKDNKSMEQLRPPSGVFMLHRFVAISRDVDPDGLR